MPGGPYPRSGYPLSRAEIAKFTRKGPYQEFLDYMAQRDVVTKIWDDFNGVAIETTPGPWAVANGGGASVASFAINLQSVGVIRATTGTGNGDTASASLISPKTIYGDLNASCEVRWSPITAVTETRIEVGFVDVVPGSDKSVINSLTTPSVNTSVVDTVLDVYDHTGSTTTNELATKGASITAAKETFTPVTAVASATSTTSRIQLIGNFALLWRDGLLVGNLSASGTDYVEGGNAMAFWAYVRASSATSKSLDLDYVRVVQNRFA